MVIAPQLSRPATMDRNGQSAEPPGTRELDRDVEANATVSALTRQYGTGR
jgi:hypothetical protein